MHPNNGFFFSPDWDPIWQDGAWHITYDVDGQRIPSSGPFAPGASYHGRDDRTSSSQSGSSAYDRFYASSYFEDLKNAFRDMGEEAADFNLKNRQFLILNPDNEWEFIEAAYGPEMFLLPEPSYSEDGQPVYVITEAEPPRTPRRRPTYKPHPHQDIFLLRNTRKI